jgi:chitinase
MNRLITLLALLTLPVFAEPLVVGYLPDYRIDSWTSPAQSPITDLIYFGIQPPEEGKLPETPVPQEHIAKAQALKQQMATRLLLCVGGWGRSEHFPAIAADDAARARFIDGLKDFCLKHGFDGVDYDWEHPQGEKQMASYVHLLAESRAAFKPHGLLVTIALASWQNIGPEGYAAVERVHLMSYDHPYPHATLAQSTRDVETLLANGCPPEKIVLGVPFYGRNKKRDARSFADLVAGKDMDPDIDEIDGFSFNGVTTIKAKMDYVKQKKLGGLMIWELSQDGGVLLRAMELNQAASS